MNLELLERRATNARMIFFQYDSCIRGNKKAIHKTALKIFIPLSQYNNLLAKANDRDLQFHKLQLP